MAIFRNDDTPMIHRYRWWEIVLIYCGARREGQWQGRSIEVANKVREAKQTQPAGNGFKAFFHATLVNTPTGKQWRIDGEAPWQLW